MKKLILIEVLVLLIMIGLTAFAIFSGESNFQTLSNKPSEATVVTDPPQTTAAPVETTTEPVTEPPTQPPTEPPTDPVVPAISLDWEGQWETVLTGHRLSASKYFVYDLDRGEFITLSDGLEKDSPIYPASTTKLFAVYVALQYMDPEEEITVGNELTLIDPNSSVAGLKEGDKLTVEDLVAGMLLPSGNDATYVMAVAVGRKLMNDPDLDPQWAINRFVYFMNLSAERLGLEDTNFVTPDGIHNEDHYIGLQDMVKIGQLALTEPLIAKYAATTSYSVTVTRDRTLTWKNTNALLQKDSKYYCQYTTGLKTGYTAAAGNCLLASFRVEEQNLLIGVFGSATSDARFADMLYLFTQTYGLEAPPASATTAAAA